MNCDRSANTPSLPNGGSAHSGTGGMSSGRVRNCQLPTSIGAAGLPLPSLKPPRGTNTSYNVSKLERAVAGTRIVTWVPEMTTLVMSETRTTSLETAVTASRTSMVPSPATTGSLNTRLSSLRDKSMPSVPATGLKDTSSGGCVSRDVNTHPGHEPNGLLCRSRMAPLSSETEYACPLATAAAGKGTSNSLSAMVTLAMGM